MIYQNKYVTNPRNIVKDEQRTFLIFNEFQWLLALEISFFTIGLTLARKISIKILHLLLRSTGYSRIDSFLLSNMDETMNEK